MKFKNIFFAGLLWIIPFTSFSCAGETDSASQLHAIVTYQLSFGEPSGIAFDEAQNVFWIVSGADQKVYKTDSTGAILQILKYDGDDLEGIALDTSKKSLWIVEERKRELLQIDLDGNILRSAVIPITGPLNSGFEGVAQDENGNIFILNEKEPGRFIELNSDLSVKAQREIYFADDFSDMVFSPKEKCFFVLSDESSSMYKWTKERGVIQKFLLPLHKFEGVAVNAAADKFFLVNDATNELTIYSLK